MATEKLTPHITGEVSPAKRSARDNNESDQYNYTDESKKAINALKKAHSDKDLKAADLIIAEMVEKSLVTGLKKIHTAAGYGFAELVDKYIKEDKMDPNCECAFNDLTSITPLHFCSGIGPDSITNDRAKCIEILVDNKADVNHSTSRKDTPLHWATKLADYQVCNKLIERGANVNLVNTDNCTCAHGAAFYKNLDILENLLNLKVDVNVMDISGKNVLMLLCKDAVDNVSYLENDSKVDKKEKEKKLVVLVERLLKEFKVDPNCKDVADFTPVMFASEHGHMELMQKLIDYKADVNMANGEGINSLLLAIVNSLPKTVAYLLKNGFDVKKSAASISYLTDSAYLNETEILKILLEAGCDVNETKQDENGVILNPLWAACERSNLEIVKILLKHGADTVIRPDLQMTSLHCTAMAQCESLAIAKLLVEHKCPLNLKSAQAGETPLFLACNSGFTEIVEYFLDLGVDPNDSSPISRSCFQQAVFRNHREIIILLINKNYKMTEEDKQDLDLFIMDLYQDNDAEMLSFILNKKLTNKEHMLECIKKVYDWQTASFKESSQTSLKDSAPSSLITTKDLKLELAPIQPNNIKTVEDLEAYLVKCNLNATKS